MAGIWTVIVAQCCIFSIIAASDIERGSSVAKLHLQSLRQRGPFTGAVAIDAPQAGKPPALPVSLALGRQPGADPKASLVKASEAAKEAWQAFGDVRSVTAEALKFPPLVQAEASNAKVAAKTSNEAGVQAAKIVDQAIKDATKAAFEEAKLYFKAVQEAAVAGKADEAATKKREASKAELKAARAAAQAAFPYHQQILRGQKVIVDYQTRAQELAAASNALKSEGFTLAGSANGYQAVGQAVQAQQMMMQAHSLTQQGQAMQREAESLHAAAMEINAALPTYHLAEQAAAESAAAQANPPTLDILGSMLPY